MIGFSLTQATLTETKTGVTGCRSYKDYTYTIAASPSAPVTANLVIEAGGSAIEGADYDLTTNGDFSAASKTIAFPAGSTQQPFTVRIYDDAIVEGNENFTLGFTVNNGGGNLVALNGRTAFAFTILDNDQPPYYGPGNLTTIAFTMSGVQVEGPFDARKPKQRAQILYGKDELTAAGLKTGTIVGLTINIQKNTPADFGFNNLTIRIAATAQNSLLDFASEFPLNNDAFTTVYTTASLKTINGFMNFDFSEPFTWDGQSNIAFDICYDNGTVTGSGVDVILGFNDLNNRTNYVLRQDVSCDANFGTSNITSWQYKPGLKFRWQEAISRPAIQSQLAVSRQEYLGPGAEVYFYDATGDNLLAKIKNTSSFDYGCTQVTVDRSNTGAGAVAFVSADPASYLLSKTLIVEPSVNNSAGNYDISLYYTKSETDAWQAATGRSINDLQVIKTTHSIGNATPANPSGSGTITVAKPSISALGSNTVLTASFNNGFSGFGAGVTGLALPVEWLDFTGLLQNQHITLNWGTATEANSRLFEIERSFDGIHFVSIGSIPAAGNSSIALHYSFTDPAAAQETNYYRLKQLDLDGKFSYSKIILLKAPGNQFRVINNPFTTSLDLDFGKAQSGKIDIRMLDIAGKEITHVVVACRRAIENTCRAG